MWNRVTALAAVLALAACRQAPQQPQFPKADRDVAAIVSDSFSTEDARDRLGDDRLGTRRPRHEPTSQPPEILRAALSSPAHEGVHIECTLSL